MKAYKIEIPEWDLITLPEAEKRLSKLEAARVCDSKEQGFSNYEITRAEIHELVQKKAERLGYNKESKLSWRSDAKYLVLSEAGFAYFGEKKEDYDKNSNQPISWQEFLELPEPGLPPYDEKLAEQARDFAYRKEIKDETRNAFPPYDEKRALEGAQSVIDEAEPFPVPDEHKPFNTRACPKCETCEMEVVDNLRCREKPTLIIHPTKEKAREFMEKHVDAKPPKKCALCAENEQITKEDCLRILELFQPEFEQPVISGGNGPTPEFVEKCKLHNNAVKQLNKYFEEPAK